MCSDALLPAGTAVDLVRIVLISTSPDLPSKIRNGQTGNVCLADSFRIHSPVANPGWLHGNRRQLSRRFLFCVGVVGHISSP